MAIYFHRDFSDRRKSRNFGDDINPFLLRHLFHRSIIESRSLCIVGIGTILNQRHAQAVQHFERKIVFSSGAGGDPLQGVFDSTWHFACVRGPMTAKALELPPEVAICDGAILLASIYEPKPCTQRGGPVFVPHYNTVRSAGATLRAICQELGVTYVSPEVEPRIFIDAIRGASLVLTEAMHGAILADCMRTPWLPVNLLQHNRFKWQDWFASVELEYVHHAIRPQIWDSKTSSLLSVVKRPYQRMKVSRVRSELKRVLQKETPVLSSDAVMEARKLALSKVVEKINDAYAT